MHRFIIENLTFEQATLLADWYRDRGEDDAHEYFAGSGEDAPIPSTARVEGDDVILTALELEDDTQ